VGHGPRAGSEEPPSVCYRRMLVPSQVRRQVDARLGSVLNGKWRLDSVLGIGGMAAVYAATHRNRKRAAIKILHRELSTDVEMRTRFVREGYLANSIGHPGAVSVLDDDVAEDGSAYTVMELLEGQTLTDFWKTSKGKLPLIDALSIVGGVLDVLVAAHDKGVVHRDLKPANIFVTASSDVKLLDFGIARLQEADGVSVTATSGTMGTPAFMAPEQARGRWELVDGRTDLWAVGATLFLLLTGRCVHVAKTANEILGLAMTTVAPSVRVFRSDLPEPVVELVDRALLFEKTDRWESAAAMRAALSIALDALKQTDNPVTVSAAPSNSVPPTKPISTPPPWNEPYSSRLTVATRPETVRIGGIPGQPKTVAAETLSASDSVQAEAVQMGTLSGVPAPPEFRAPRRSLPLWLLAAGLTVTVGVVAVLYVAFDRAAPSSPSLAKSVSSPTGPSATTLADAPAAAAVSQPSAATQAETAPLAPIPAASSGAEPSVAPRRDAPVISSPKRRSRPVRPAPNKTDVDPFASRR
jgi:eukaryotic-like serine/threonine-protein kinase